MVWAVNFLMSILNSTDGKSKSYEDSLKMHQTSKQGSLKVLRKKLVCQWSWKRLWSQCHISYEPLTFRYCCVFCWACVHSDWHCISSGTSFALRSSSAWGFSRTLDKLLIHLFKTRLLCRSNNCYFAFNPLCKVWHRPQMTWLAVYGAFHLLWIGGASG